ncbi:hypothetical protein AACH10_00610 [Ideonella sp. DXS22W]|uniref:Baseplate protein J-like domain-containing protein n=1 Tax=Pseudaquabacterium inlustre TaxID=2984192 RepID=A0ABU9CA23_9BURK
MSALPSDGTSQAARHWPELDPAHAVLAPHGPREWLQWLRAYGRELVFVDDTDPQARGDWRGLLGEPGDLDLDTVAAWLEAAARVPVTTLEPTALPAWPPGLTAPMRERLSRPHLALLMAFVALLARSRDGINGIAARHLSLLYRDTLRLVPRPAQPEWVHVLAEPDTVGTRALLPAGTLLEAGRDDAGRDRFFRTEAELSVSGIRVAGLRSLRADIRRTGLREAAFAHRVSGTRQQAFVGMWRIALGQPAPGDALPTPIVPGLPALVQGQPPAIDFDALLAADELLRFVIDRLAMPLLDEYRQLMRLRQQRRERDPADAATLRAVLAQVAAAVRPGVAFAAGDPQDFEADLARALGLDANGYAHLFDGLPEVKQIDQVFAVLPARADVQAFVQQRLRLSLDDFRRMMLARRQIEGGWSEIARLVEAAARRRRGDPAWSLPAAVRRQRQVEAWLLAGLEVAAFPVGGRADAGLDGFHAAFEGIERWASMSAERFRFVMDVGRRMPAPEAADWPRVFDILAAAHQASVLARRRAQLAQAAAPGRRAGQPAQAVAAVLAAVLDDDAPPAEALARLAGLGVPADDLAALARLQAGSALDEAGWSRLLAVLEVAQRNRENLVLVPPQQVQWHWLHALADARQATVPGAQPGRFSPFGQVPPARPEAPPEPNLGCALASPLLWLAEGQRSVQLLLGFDGGAASFDAEALRRLLAPADGQGGRATVVPWLVQLSTDKGWTEPASVQLEWNAPAAATGTGAARPAFGGYPAVAGVDTAPLRLLRLVLALDEKQPATAAPTLAVHGLTAAAPVLRLMLRPAWDDALKAWTSPYTLLRRLRLQRLKLVVNVTGLASLRLRSDDAVLDARKPFEPFGFRPAPGARLQIGHAELVAKPLDSVGFRFEWMGTPPSLDSHYANYEGPVKLASFTARVGLRDGLRFSPADAPMRLFGDGSPADAVQQRVAPLPEPGAPAWPPRLPAQAADVGEWPRCLVWELAGDFQHAAYPGQALKKSLQLAAAIATKQPSIDPTAYQLNPPYTPKLKRLLVDYSASVEVPVASPAVGGTSGDGLLQLLHLHPFGSQVIGAADRRDGMPLLPACDDEGTLCIALAQARAPQRLNLLLQLAEGSADPDVAPPALRWSVLDGDQWRSLHDQGELLADGTRGLVNAGIVALQLPAVQTGALLPDRDGDAPLLWLRVSAAQGCAGVCDVLGVHPDAVLAECVPADADAEDVGAAAAAASPLAAGTITAPQQPVTGIARLQQPYSGFGGRVPEDDRAFRVRASERLRHRGRALTPWDAERLVLERFPQLHKVRCLRADEFDPALAPPAGTVTVVVVPDMVRRQPFDPAAPKVPADQIRDIHAFLAPRLPQGARLRVVNPHVVPLKVRCGIRFRAGVDEGLARQRVGEALNRHLAPWAWAEGADLVIGGRIPAHGILHFLEQRDEIDYVAELRLFTADDGHWRPVADAGDGQGPGASPGRPDGLLVPAPQHEFLVIGEADYRAEGLDGIGHMKVELDFIVA